MKKNTTAKTARIASPLEAAEQSALVEWLELKRWKFTAIPNSTYTSSWKQKAKNAAMGLRSGFPDMVVVVPTRTRGKVLIAIEMKRRDGVPSDVSPEQRAWLSALSECAGVTSGVCNGCEAAMRLLTELSKS